MQSSLIFPPKPNGHLICLQSPSVTITSPFILVAMYTPKPAVAIFVFPSLTFLEDVRSTQLMITKHLTRFSMIASFQSPPSGGLSPPGLESESVFESGRM